MYTLLEEHNVKLTLPTGAQLQERGKKHSIQTFLSK